MRGIEYRRGAKTRGINYRRGSMTRGTKNLPPVRGVSASRFFEASGRKPKKQKNN